MEFARMARIALAALKTATGKRRSLLHNVFAVWEARRSTRILYLWWRTESAAMTTDVPQTAFRAMQILQRWFHRVAEMDIVQGPRVM